LREGSGGINSEGVRSSLRWIFCTVVVFVRLVYGIFVDMYIDGIGNETTRKMRLYSMYVFIPNKRERDLKGKTYIELDSASTNNMLYNIAFDDMYLNFEL